MSRPQVERVVAFVLPGDEQPEAPSHRRPAPRNRATAGVAPREEAASGMVQW
jgi:hypothetical protein